MIRLLFGFCITPIKLVVMAIGVMALYAYVTGADIGVVVTDFIAGLTPLKDALVNALQTLLPMLLEQVSKIIQGFK